MLTNKSYIAIMRYVKGGGENMQNIDLRLRAKGAGVPLWRIAEALRISEPTLTRHLRKELSEKEKRQILSIIEKLKGVD